MAVTIRKAASLSAGKIIVKQNRNNLKRREFLKTSIGLVSTFGFSAGIQAGTVLDAAPRRLAFHHLHTGETIDCQYWKNGRYDPVALEDIDHVLRDWRTGDVRQMNRELLDLLTLVRNTLNSDKAYGIISGYRSPRTNAALRARSSGVAKLSQHMQGKAVDVRLAGASSAILHKVARRLALGGVGYYRKSDFVHLDVGRPRHWSG